MATIKRKSSAAVELGRLRWKGKTKDERTAHARMMVASRKDRKRRKSA